MMRLRALILLGLAAFMACVPLGHALAFTDVGPTTPHSEAIAYLSSRGIVAGFDDGSFRPDSPVIRQQFAKMVVLSVGFSVAEKDTCGFQDIPHSGPSLYPYHFVAVAANNGLVKGYDHVSFGPLDQITRMQLITITARAAEAVLLEPPDDWRGLVASSNPTHGENIRRAEYSGLLAGVARNLASWDPKKAATRGEVAQLLYNLLVRTADRPPLSVTNYEAKGDGVTDDNYAIEVCITAAALADRDVYLPAGTYRIASTIALPTGDPEYDNLVIRGAGVEQTIITMDTVDAQSAPVYMYTANNLSGVHLSDMTFRTPAAPYPTNVKAIISTGMQNSSIERIRIENSDFGIKLGSGAQAHGWLLKDIQTSNIGCLSLELINVSDSSFINLTLQNRTDTGTGMGVYIEADNHLLTFENLHVVGGARNCMQLFNGNETPTSDHISFADTYLDNSGGPKYPLTIDASFFDVTFTNTTLIGNDSKNPCIVWYGGTRVVFDGIAASGGAALQMQYGTTAPVDCQIRNGTYRGSAIGSVNGVSVTNVILEG